MRVPGFRSRGPLHPAVSLRRILPFLGPAFVASVAYVDPGNFATNVQAGSAFGYRLLWVIMASNLMAMLLQALSAKLGIATGQNLAELCRIHFPRSAAFWMWIVMEGVAIATDLAEFIGAALGFQLLFGFPLLWGGLLTALATLAILETQRRGYRPLEATITVFIGIIALCYLVETTMEQPDWSAVAVGAFVPRFSGAESVLLATGILGATVMPHALFLHSALTQRRIEAPTPDAKRHVNRFERADVLVAMTVAGLVNAAILVMAAATFFRADLTEVATLEEAYRTLDPLLGPVAKEAFGLSLLAAGLSSSAVGTMAGQTIMQGFLQRRIPLWTRRLVTMAPSLVVIALGFEPTRTLVWSQVALSFGLPFAVVPLIRFTSQKAIMGDLVNRPVTTASAGVVGGLILALNAYLLYALATS